MRLYAWDQEFSTEETDDLLSRLALWHISQIGNQGERERIAAGITSNGVYSLCDHSPSLELSALDYYHSAQSSAFFRKRDDIDRGIDKELAAYEKFCESEIQCSQTNDAFRAWEQGRLQFDPAVEAVLSAAQRKISRVLGRLPFRRELLYRFGPGATTHIPKRKACATLKLSQKPACSGELSTLVKFLLEDIPSYTFAGFEGDVRTVEVEIHPGRLSFVPKSYKTKRAVVVEPWLNTFAQLAIGDFIADRLRRVGQDIRDQTRNQTLARRGSIDGSLATLDLSSASDTISTKLVEHLLPDRWFYLLSVLRTGRVEYDGRRIELQKFSSMGNGFTFPLETLIFWAVTSSVVGDENSVSVYGDDIICPASKAEEVMRVLRCLGFTPNSEKSFWTGPFRESCGKDYLSGIDVRPIFIDGVLTGQDIFRLHNHYVRMGYLDVAQEILKIIDPSIHLWGPDGYGDGHLLGSWEPHRSEKHRKRQWGGCTFDTYTYGKNTFKGCLPGDRILPAYSVYVRGSCDPFSYLRGDTPILDKNGAVTFPSSGNYRYGRKGELVSMLPGRKGVKRITIYTLHP